MATLNARTDDQVRNLKRINLNVDAVGYRHFRMNLLKGILNIGTAGRIWMIQALYKSHETHT